MRSVWNAFLAAIFLLPLACSTHTSNNGDRFVDTDYDFEILPYQIVESHKTDWPMNPVLLGSGRGLGVYEIQQGGKTELVTPIIFGDYPSESGDRLRQFNIHAKRIKSHLAADLDSDSIQEVAIAYVTDDTMRIEVLDPLQDRSYKGNLLSGTDRNGWVTAAPDLNGDHHMKLVLSDSYDTCIRFWLNDGAKHFSEYTVVPNVNAPAKPTMVDLSNDDRLDLINVAFSKDYIAW